MNKCNSCVNQGDICVHCKDNPIYANYPQVSYHQTYKPACPIGAIDCVGDPAYIKFHYPDWYKELYGDKTPKEAALKCRPDWEDRWCRDYDDEDK